MYVFYFHLKILMYFSIKTIMRKILMIIKIYILYDIKKR